MNRTKLKTYAPQARREFIQAVTDRAAYYGLTAKHIEPISEKGDVAIVAGKPFPRAVAQKRKALEDRIVRLGFEQTMEALAYTWFNRLVAIRFMELHGYLDHGYRVLSHPEGKATPEILEHAEHVDLPGLDKNTVIDLKLDGSKEAELYRMLLIAQCNALHAAMSFLFERIDDETELLLPDNLLHSDSLIRKLVNEIDEEDWQEVEIIGWLYQFYISEKKDQVIGKVVKSEDIPAATQLFTPNWIVKYLVQNSLGRQWLATYPNSPLRQQMEYYIEPAEQTPEVQAQLKAITPESLNPEELTLLDPACGSGHILVEAYDLFKAIYQERGYRARDIPTLILQKNLFGLEIDDRAAQLAAFALMMKARADDRRIFTSGVQPHVLAIQESKGLNAKTISEALNTPLAHGEKKGEKGGISQADVADLINLFEHGKTFGSLIQVPLQLAEKLPAMEKRVRDVLAHGDLMTQPAAKVLLPLIEQAWMLSRQYDAVVANPPYMGGKYFNGRLKDFVADHYEELESRFFQVGSHFVAPADFKKLPGEVLAYWISDKERDVFASSDPFWTIAQPRQGLATADDSRFLRLWHEVSIDRVAFNIASKQEAIESSKKWFPFLKGGPFRRWYGNYEHLVNWQQDGIEIKAFRPRSVVRNELVYFQEGITWSSVSIGLPSFRLFGKGFIISHVGPGIYTNTHNLLSLLAYLNSRVVTHFFGILSPAAHFEIGQVRDLPFRNPGPRIMEIAEDLVDLHRKDWNSFETSWDFQTLPVLQQRAATLAQSQAATDAEVLARFQRMKQLEEENNRLFIEAYGLQDELSPEVPEDQITLARPDREEDIKRLISYAIGCMMGRYKPQNTLNTQKEERENLSCDSCISWFGADQDGIVPIMDADWFPDDAANRFVEFISVAWPKEHLEENLTFVAESLSVNRGEQPRDTIRRYLATGFFKDHLRTYKRRPIYWLFSSGKQRAFQCLVYLHRYNEGTLSRMRTEYVIPLQGKSAARIDHLASDIAAATSTSHRKKLEKERDTLRKQQTELHTFDEKLRHYADMRISLDLDDGVKVNYGKFGDLLAEVKAVCGE